MAIKRETLEKKSDLKKTEEDTYLEEVIKEQEVKLVGGHTFVLKQLGYKPQKRVMDIIGRIFKECKEELTIWLDEYKKEREELNKLIREENNNIVETNKALITSGNAVDLLEAKAFITNIDVRVLFIENLDLFIDKCPDAVGDVVKMAGGKDDQFLEEALPASIIYLFRRIVEINFLASGYLEQIGKLLNAMPTA